MNFLSFINRISFSLPTKCDLIIYDEIHKDLILDLIPNTVEVFILKKRPSIIYLNIYFNLLFLRNIFRIKCLSLIINKGLIRGFCAHIIDSKDLTIINVVEQNVSLLLLIINQDLED